MGGIFGSRHLEVGILTGGIFGSRHFHMWHFWKSTTKRSTAYVCMYVGWQSNSADKSKAMVTGFLPIGLNLSLINHFCDGLNLSLINHVRSDFSGVTL
jgi:hypothetical protein